MIKFGKFEIDGFALLIISILVITIVLCYYDIRLTEIRGEKIQNENKTEIEEKVGNYNGNK